VEAGGQSRLGDEQRFGGPADAAAAGDLEEPLDLHQLNAAGLAVTRFVYGQGLRDKFYLWGRGLVLDWVPQGGCQLGRPLPAGSLRERADLPSKWGGV
jgi:hypothetical protein